MLTKCQLDNQSKKKNRAWRCIKENETALLYNTNASEWLGLLGNIISFWLSSTPIVSMHHLY